MNDDFQRKAVQFQIMETNIKALQAKSDDISQRIEEGLSTRHAIEELKGAKPTGALIPLGSGNFAAGRIENTDEIIVGLGSGVAVKKSREEALAFLDISIKELEGSLDEMRNQIMSIAFQMEKLQGELEGMQK